MSEFNQKTIARRFAFQFLYHLQLLDYKDFNHEEILHKIAEFEKINSEPDQENNSRPIKAQGKKFAIELICGAIKNHNELKNTISTFLKKWTIERLNKVDFTILLLATFELTKNPTTPKNVVINEAVELAKLFATQESPSFINAILDKVAKA